MAQINGIYKCSVCGNIVTVLHSGGGTLVCCGKNMELLISKSNDDGQEKHVPVIEKNDQGYTVKIGSIPHPMEDTHYIEWIELIADGKSYFCFLKPGDAPEAEFCLKALSVSVRTYCNIHGLWQNS